MNGERRSEGGGVGGAGDAAPGGVNSILWNRWEGDAPENIRDYLERGERFPALPGVYEAGAALVVVGFVLRVGRRVGGFNGDGDGERVCCYRDTRKGAGGCCCHCCGGWTAEAEESAEDATHGGRWG